jgi:hypothetical protein
MNQSIRRTLTGAAIGAGVGYLASKGMFIDPGMPDALAQHMTANLPSSGSATGVGAALGATAMAAYEAGKHRVLSKKQFGE